ncbi:MAG: CPBP family intramembrane metalloprotease, partial [Candidatus Sungbacteria bacterium]|nr:CPBP family intramembrane metalloprotease [Candidatus Sungbacteria bacterium]
MEKTIPERLWIGFKFGLIDLALTFFVIVPLLFLTGIGSKLPVIVDKNEPFTVMLFLEMVVLAPFFEEFVFRFLPISFTRLVTSNVMVLWSVIIIASILFGRAHGSWWNVFAQGVGGIIFAFAFLRGGYVS